MEGASLFQANTSTDKDHRLKCKCSSECVTMVAEGGVNDAHRNV